MTPRKLRWLVEGRAQYSLGFRKVLQLRAGGACQRRWSQFEYKRLHAGRGLTSRPPPKFQSPIAGRIPTLPTSVNARSTSVRTLAVVGLGAT